MIIKALSVKQPWASLIVDGNKTIETRTWSTSYRGDLLIVSSKEPDRSEMFTRMRHDDRFKPGMIFLLGQALCIARLVDCRPMTAADMVAACCGGSKQLWAWCLEDVRKIEPFPVKGQLRLYDVEMPEGFKQK